MKLEKCPLKILLLLDFMLTLWLAGLISVVMSCKSGEVIENVTEVKGMVIQCQELVKGDKSRMYTENNTNLVAGQHVIVNNVYANCYTLCTVDNVISNYWYDVEIISHNEKE